MFKCDTLFIYFRLLNKDLKNYIKNCRGLDSNYKFMVSVATTETHNHHLIFKTFLKLIQS